MSTNIFNPQTLLATKEKYKSSPLLKLEGDVRTGGKTEKGKKKIQSYYIPFKCKNIAGKYVPLQLKFIKQVTASGARLPYNISEDDAKHVTVLYRKLTEEDLANSDYPEAKREGLLQLNDEFTKALDVIADEYLDLVKREVLPECKKKESKFKLLGSKKIHCFRQTHRDAGENDETEETKTDEEESKTDDDKPKIKLENPMFRIKLKADPVSKKIGTNFNGKYTPTVYDMKKTAKESVAAGKTKKVVAKVIVRGVPRDLTIKNVRHFVTYLSTSGGIITFESVCISSQGISLLCHFRELHIWRHKPMKQETLNTADITDMADCGMEGEDEDVNIEDEDEELEKTSKTKVKDNKKNNSKAMKDLAFENAEDEEDFGGLDEPDENNGDDDIDDPDDIENKTKPIEKKKTEKKLESAKKKNIKEDKNKEEKHKGEKNIKEERDESQEPEENEEKDTEENTEQNEVDESQEVEEDNEKETKENTEQNEVSELEDNKQNEQDDDEHNEKPKKPAPKKTGAKKLAADNLKAGARKKSHK